MRRGTWLECAAIQTSSSSGTPAVRVPLALGPRAGTARADNKSRGSGDAAADRNLGAAARAVRHLEAESVSAESHPWEVFRTRDYSQ